MANTNSAKKRARQTIRKTIRNQAVKGQIRTALKKAYKVIQDGQTGDLVKQSVLEAVSTVMKAAAKGVLHKKNASRKVSRLTASYSQLLKKSLSSGEAGADAAPATKTKAKKASASTARKKSTASAKAKSKAKKK
jgi:small subunit ribosomal protein S20